MAEIEIPPYFLCPISLEIMKDPVTVSTGITYDRDSIEKWIFSDGNLTCPVTRQPLSDPELTPNVTLRRVIQSWSSANALERLPTPRAPVGKSEILKILGVAKSPDMHANCLTKFQAIASASQSNRRAMESAGVVEFLASVIIRKTLELSRTNPLQEEEPSSNSIDEALSILFTLQLSEKSLASLSNADFISSLTSSMLHGSFESRAYSIMLLNQTLEFADPSTLIGLKPDFFLQSTLILKDQISKKASKSALNALITSAPWGRNRIKAVESGIIPILIEQLLDQPEKRACETILALLDLLCQCAEGRAEFLGHASGMTVVSKKILRVSQAASEKGVRILHSVAKYSATKGILQEMIQFGVVAKLCLVLQVDSGIRTKEKALEILKMHHRTWRNSPCRPHVMDSIFASV